MFISVERRTPGNLEPEAWAALRRVLDIIESCKASSGDPRDIFAAIEEDPGLTPDHSGGRFSR
jgi:hypothetical protein